MKILVVSDIHGNLDALESVLRDAGDFEAVWCLGDITGYGPNPNECVALIKEQPNLLCVRGNHDVAALKQIDISSFNYEAQKSMRWLQSVVSRETITFLESLPEKLSSLPVTLVHGSPRNPIWEYILEPKIARLNFPHFNTDYCFVGHTHQPMISQLIDDEFDWFRPEVNEVIQMSEKMILNPGSVGQPRDFDPRASYAIFDDSEQTWTIKRASYDIQAVQKKIKEKNLPLRHAQRLEEGW